MVYVEMIEPPAQTLRIRHERYCLRCHSCSVHFRQFRRLVFHLEFDLFAVMMDLSSKNYATFCSAVLESPISNQNVQSFFKSQTTQRIFIEFFCSKLSKN